MSERKPLSAVINLTASTAIGVLVGLTAAPVGAFTYSVDLSASRIASEIPTLTEPFWKADSTVGECNGIDPFFFSMSNDGVLLAYYDPYYNDAIRRQNRRVARRTARRTARRNR